MKSKNIKLNPIKKTKQNINRLKMKKIIKKVKANSLIKNKSKICQHFSNFKIWFCVDGREAG